MKEKKEIIELMNEITSCLDKMARNTEKVINGLSKLQLSEGLRYVLKYINAQRSILNRWEEDVTKIEKITESLNPNYYSSILGKLKEYINSNKERVKEQKDTFLKLEKMVLSGVFSEIVLVGTLQTLRGRL